MARRPNDRPTYRYHKKTGRAIITVRTPTGARQDMLLPGAFDSPESREEYDRVCALIAGNGGQMPAPALKTPDLTIAELVLRYMQEHVPTYYRNLDTGEPTGEVACLKQAFRPLTRLYGSEPVVAFDSLKLEALQTAMALGSWLNAAERERKKKQNRPLGMCRNTVNDHIERIKRLFTWGCAKKVVPAEVLVNLQAVKGLKRGRTVARDTELVEPVAVEIVEATRQCLRPVLADIVQLLLLSGARAGEVCRMRGAELDRTGPVWLFRPRQHKGLHRGQNRVIALGPRAQLILRKYLRDDPDAFLFSPAEAEAQRLAELRAMRKTKVQPSQVNRSKPNPKRKPGPVYSPRSVNHAIRAACERAGVSRWHTHQLRHTASLLIEREYGIEAARAALGHRQVNMTAHYSGIDVERAKQVAAQVG